MVWTGIGISLGLLSATAVTAALLRKRPLVANDLGAVSDRWITQHRAGSP
jgi:hypothetical protein